MPKLVDYPRASLKAALELAEAVESLGGGASVQMAADKLGKKVGGSFQALVGAAVKYGLLDSKRQRLAVTQLFTGFKLAYSKEEETQRLSEMLLSPPLFKLIYDRFVGRELPITHFEKLLIREFDVPQDIASRVGSYFLDGAQHAGLLTPENKLITQVQSALESSEAQSGKEELGESAPMAVEAAPAASAATPHMAQAEPVSTDYYIVRVSGPGMNTSIEVREADDLLIVQAILKKVERALEETD